MILIKHDSDDDEKLEDWILIEAKRVRRERKETPQELPEDIPTAVLKDAVERIDSYLKHYREGKDGTEFRYMKRSEIARLDKTRSDRRTILREAWESLAWIMSDEMPEKNGGVTFREVCDFKSADPDMTRQMLIDSLFGEVHQNAFRTLKEYGEWESQAEPSCDCDTCHPQEYCI